MMTKDIDQLLTEIRNELDLWESKLDNQLENIWLMGALVDEDLSVPISEKLKTLEQGMDSLEVSLNLIERLSAVQKVGSASASGISPRRLKEKLEQLIEQENRQFRTQGRAQLERRRRYIKAFHLTQLVDLAAQADTSLAQTLNIALLTARLNYVEPSVLLLRTIFQWIAGEPNRNNHLQIVETCLRNETCPLMVILLVDEILSQFDDDAAWDSFRVRFNQIKHAHRNYPK